jgi:hypothetical protein
MPRRLTRLGGAALALTALLAPAACGTGRPSAITAVADTDAITTTTTTATTTTTTTTAAATSTAAATTVPIATAPLTTPRTTAPPTTVVPTTVAPNTLLALDVLATLTTGKEHRGGYDRDLFGYPASFGGGCNTRAVILQRDSLSPAQVDPGGCTVVAGDWYSVYDGVTTDQPHDLEIDHVVALKEAWDSGAWQWSTAALEAFANDVADPRTLRAVTSNTNQSKSDKDPSNWLPPNADDVCRYVGDWVAIKARWHLQMDTSEFGRIRNVLRGPCAGWRVATWAPAPAPLP